MSYKLLYCAVFLGVIMLIRLENLNYGNIRFNDYLLKFNKSYNAEEYQRRLHYFEKSLAQIEILNSETHGTGATHALTKFSDWSHDEKYASTLRGYGYPDGCREVNYSHRVWSFGRRKKEYSVYMDNSRIDWRGYIGQVQNQKLCNACWAFGVVGVMQAMADIQLKIKEQLSVQELIDCDDGSLHCNGGNMGQALDFITSLNFNITTVDKYPLKLVTEKCRGHPRHGRGVSHYAIGCNVSNEYVMKRLGQGPLVAVINAEPLFNYVEGVVQRNCAPFPGYRGLFHVVIVVGYDTTGDLPYFILQNSWGSDWGEDGYFRLSMGDNNVCGVKNQIANIHVY